MQPSVSLKTVDARLAGAVREGLTRPRQKQLPAEFFYDDIGSALFEVITLLPEYGLTRADRRILMRHCDAIAALLPRPVCVIELGSGSGSKTANILRAIGSRQPSLRYFPIDVSCAALDRCCMELSGVASVRPIENTFAEGIRVAMSNVPAGSAVLVLFLGSTIGNFDREHAVAFLAGIRSELRAGDMLLLGADLVKDAGALLLAYDDPAGVTAAFNLNLLARINRELGANFDLRRFRHFARYDDVEKRVEMHLASREVQTVSIPAAECDVVFETGETIWTESSHKYELPDLDRMAPAAGFTPVDAWTDEEWPFAEALWRAV